MNKRLIIDDDSVYEIDTECLQKKQGKEKNNICNSNEKNESMQEDSRLYRR